MGWILILIASIGLILDLLAAVFWRGARGQASKQTDLPFVSVLVAVRNEASNVAALVASLKALDYPPDRIEVLLGDDRSTDGTADLLRLETGSDPRFNLIAIQEDLPNLCAKANVIAQLVTKSRGQYLFITDADVRVPKPWIRALLEVADRRVGVVGGCTVVSSNGLWTYFQGMDWLVAQGLLVFGGRWFGTLAVSGTNMMITRESCTAIGGYDKIPYSLTEDIGYLIAARRRGFAARQVIHKDATATVNPEAGFKALLLQRQRWIYGVMKMPPLVITLLIIRASFLPAAAALFWWFPSVSLFLIVTKVLVTGLLAKRVAITLSSKTNIIALLGFEIYYALISLGGLIWFLLPLKIRWKGRTYG